MKDIPDRFKNTKAVFEYLKAEGYKVGKSKLYDDAKTGLLRVQKDKSVLAVDVKLYAATLKVDGKEFDIRETADVKAQREIEKLEIQIEKATFELEKEKGKWLPRDEFDRELAARGAILDANIRQMFESCAAEWIAAVAGNPLKEPDLLQLMQQSFDSVINEFASTQLFQVMVVDAEPDSF